MEAALRRVAVHEAGHAVAACALRLLVREVLIRDDGRGHVAYYPVPISHSNIARRAVASYAGPAAERQRFGDARAAGDLARIRERLDQLGLDWERQRDGVARGAIG
jgi:hypothetical protein